jgi:hypothetical protein
LPLEQLCGTVERNDIVKELWNRAKESRRVWFWGVIALAVGILYIRKGDSLTNPQFWAEDGVIFFLQQYEQGIRAIFNPQDGYLLLVPRLVAIVSQWFLPYRFHPAFYNYCSLLFTLVVIADVFSERLKFKYKPVMAIAVVLVPHYANEIFLNITNIQWILSLLLVTTVLKVEPDAKYGNVTWQKAWDLSTTFVCGLTGPFIVFAAPLFIYKWYTTRHRHRAWLMGVAIFAAGVQGLMQITHSEIPRQEMPNVLLCLGIIGFRAFADNFVGLWMEDVVGRYASLSVLMWVFFGLFVGMCAVIAIAAYRRKVIMPVAIMAAFAAMIITVTFARYTHNLSALFFMDFAPRYSYIPAVMLVWSMVMCLGQPKMWTDVVIKVLLAAMLLSSFTSGFRNGPAIECDWAKWSQQIGKQPDLRIPINPYGWEIVFGKHQP